MSKPRTQVWGFCLLGRSLDIASSGASIPHMKILLWGLAILSASAAHAGIVCPNGQWVQGSTCTLCPDGQYVDGTICVLSPNGRFVGGQTGAQLPSRLQNARPAPEPARVDSTPFSNQLTSPLDLVPSAADNRRDNNRRNRNDNAYTQCPDGTYVTGRYCVMTPNGRYIGRP